MFQNFKTIENCFKVFDFKVFSNTWVNSSKGDYEVVD